MHSFIDGPVLSLIIASIENRTPSTPVIEAVNESAIALFGYQTQQLIDKPLDRLLSPSNPEEFWQEMLEKMPFEQTSISFQAELKDATDSPFPALISLCRLALSEADNVSRFALLIQKLGEKTQLDINLILMLRAVEQSASAVIITDPSGRIEYINPKFCEMTGYAKEELLGFNPKILQSGDTTAEQYLNMWQQLLSRGEWRGEIKNQKKNGEDYWAFESISTIKNSQGQITHVLAVEEDITERKHFEAALKESEERFRQMAEMTGEWLWEQDPNGYYIYSSNAVETIIGYTPEDVLGKHYTELLTPQDQTSFQTFSSVHKPFYSLLNHYRHKDGHEVIAESTGLPITDKQGNLIKWRGVDRDITARKHYEDALIESEKRTRLIIETALNAIIIMDSYGIITDWNQRAELVFGWSREEAIGQNVAGLIVPKRFRKSLNDELQTFLQTGKSSVLNKLTEQVALRKDGVEFPIELSVAPLKIGHAYEFSGFVHDITGRKAAERQIRMAQVNLAIAQNEMRIAQNIQASLLPSAPVISNQFKITGFCLPATQVGGDYFDYFYRDDTHLDMIIADVSGHAVGPALFMVSARSAIRAQAHWPASPAQTLNVLNDFLFAALNHSDYFITLFYLQYDTQTHHLRYANAGHPPPLLYRHARAQCEQLDTDGLIVGVREHVEFEEKRTVLAEGDCLLLYTDGLTEAENPQGDFFGTERLVDIFSQSTEYEPDTIIDNIVQQLKQFCQTEVFNDDITLMVFKRVNGEW
ncbi:PAS domain S-box protein [Methylotuvimicrobium sp. KM2]|uniref:PAS domain S-box protein n=1 Tax=Methylotuvimicrobium sp. KM2 TaxID=3133976 RepID=UPI003100DE52